MKKFRRRVPELRPHEAALIRRPPPRHHDDAPGASWSPARPGHGSESPQRREAPTNVRKSRPQSCAEHCPAARDGGHIVKQAVMRT